MKKLMPIILIIASVILIIANFILNRDDKGKGFWLSIISSVFVILAMILTILNNNEY